jgi:hypothetical protein
MAKGDSIFTRFEGFREFVRSSLGLFAQADDPDEVAELLAKGEVDEAIARMDVTEEELAEYLDALSEEAEGLSEDKELQEALSQT